MSFEEIFKTDIKNENLNKQEYRQGYKERIHVSKGKIDLYSNAKYLKAGEFFAINYKDETEMRYIAAANMTYDMIISIFDVNTKNLLVYRVFKFTELVRKDMAKIIDLLKKAKPNLEGRVIGLQNNQDFFALQEIADFLVSKGIRFVEVDLFGANTRHIAIDAKLGTSYNVLMEDRLYRPGELVNPLTLENFESQLKQQDSSALNK